MGKVYSLTMPGIMNASRAALADTKQVLWLAVTADGDTRQVLWLPVGVNADTRQVIWLPADVLADTRQIVWVPVQVDADFLAAIWASIDIQADTRQFLWAPGTWFGPYLLDQEPMRVYHGRVDLVPRAREHIEEVPGRHGSLDFGSELEDRLAELEIFINTFDRDLWADLVRKLAEWFRPDASYRELVLPNDPLRCLMARGAGKVSLESLAAWGRITVPLRCKPWVFSRIEREVTVPGGQQVRVWNDGTAPCPVGIQVKGPGTNPQVTVGSQVLSWTGSLASTDSLDIDAEAMTVTLNGVNALDKYSGGFPQLAPQDHTTVQLAGADRAVIKYRERWY